MLTHQRFVSLLQSTDADLIIQATPDIWKEGKHCNTGLYRWKDLATPRTQGGRGQVCCTEPKNILLVDSVANLRVILHKSLRRKVSLLSFIGSTDQTGRHRCHTCALLHLQTHHSDDTVYCVGR